jgi:transcription antitermination factor NusG
VIDDRQGTNMLAITESGNLAQVRRELTSGDLNVGDFVDYGAFNPFAAEIVPGITPKWHLIETRPNHERIAAAHLVARRFGVFIPESELTVVRRGRKYETTRLMFTGYLFIFVWDILKHQRRIESCPGVARIMRRIDEHDHPPAVISDGTIDQIRAVENGERPLPEIMLPPEISRPKSKKKNKKKYKLRKKDKELHAAPAQNDNDIVACYAWSPFQQDLKTLDADGRNQTLRKALGLS